MTTSAILFDLDGTLLDTAPDFRTALNRLLQDEGQEPLDLETVRVMVSNGSANLVINAFGIDSSHADFERLKEQLLTYYGEHMLEQTRPFTGLDVSLELLEDAGITWGVVTNKPMQFSQAIMQGLNLQPAALVCPEHVNQPKPDPAGILLACEQINRPAGEVVYVGDHRRDIDAGRSAGCGTLAAAYGYREPDDDPMTWGADRVIHDAILMPEIITELIK